MSAEHYMSRSVLEAIGPITVAGAHWLAPGERKQVGINALTAKILCRRHNSALSPLDSEAGCFVRKLQEIFRQIEHRTMSRRRQVALISGEALELWMLKTACGFFYSKNALKEGANMIDDHMVKDRLVSDAFYSNRWSGASGLYIRAPVQHVVSISSEVNYAPLSSAWGKRIVGGRLTILGLQFDLVFDPQGVNFTGLVKDGWHYRPTELLFGRGARTYSVALTWQPGTPQKCVHMFWGLPPPAGDAA